MLRLVRKWSNLIDPLTGEREALYYLGKQQIDVSRLRFGRMQTSVLIRLGQRWRSAIVTLTQEIVGGRDEDNR